MSIEKNATQDYSIRVTPRAPWRLKSVKALPGYCLFVKFLDDEETSGEVDMSQLITSKKAGVFESLRDPSLFNEVKLEYGAVTWPNELDLAPDAMYQEIKQHGKWIMQA